MKKILFLLGACIVLGACSTGDAAAALMMMGSSSQPPVFIDCRAVSETEIEFEFSQPVNVTSISFDPALAVASVEDGSTVRVRLEESAQPGVILTADLLAEDARKNTVNVLVPFRSKNNRMPALVINELRSEQSGNKYEFIEFIMKTAGNLGAMRVFIASNPKAPMVYEFMPVEVRQGERVVLHLRTKAEIYKDEYGSDLTESTATDSSPTARDIWLPGNTELLRKTDAVYVLDQDDNVLDAVMFSETPADWWAKAELAQAAEFLFNKGAWKNADGNICSPAEAVSNAGATSTKSIGRIENAEDTNTAADWRMSPTSGATPGLPNK